MLFKLALAKAHNFPIMWFSLHWFSKIFVSRETGVWLHVWCFDLFPCPRKTISWFYKSNRNWAPWLRSLAGGPGFSAQSLETYTHISRAGCASTVRGSRCNIRCLGTRGLVINPGWWTTGQCPRFFNPKDNLSEQDLRQVRGSKLQASGCLLQVLWAKDRVWHK